MRIAVCDDQKIQVDLINSLINEYKEQYSNITIDNFYCGEDLVTSLISGNNYDIVFLDIQMKGLDGIQAADQITKINKSTIIFFITSFTKYVSNAFSLNAFQFMIKPINRESFKREFERAVKLFYDMKRKYSVFYKDKLTIIEIKDITYIEAYNRRLYVHTDCGRYECIGKLKDEENKLKNYGFVRTHQGYLVNMAYIRSIDKSTIQLVPGDIVLISKHMKKKVLERLNKYILESCL